MPADNQSAWSRPALLDRLGSKPHSYDVVVIGGGITGAGIVREAARAGLSALLVEQKDFAWGTSSRSSKMVHGGLRYLAGGHFRLTRDAVRERQRLLDEAPGLVDPLPFVMPHYRRQFPGPRIFGALLTVYDRMAGQQNHEHLKGDRVLDWVPGLSRKGLYGGSRFADAVTDDARLVLRVLDEAVKDGAEVLNYTRADKVLRDAGRVSGVQLFDEIGDTRLEVKTGLVVNATGAWTDQLRGQLGADSAIRPLRGSHLIFPYWRLPVGCTVSLFHPDDGRPVFVFPWEGVTVVGTTDLDHQGGLKEEPCIAREEVEYLMALVHRLFPDSPVSTADIMATWAGVRPVVSSGGTPDSKTRPQAPSKAPSKENREHAIWDDQGLVSVAGGKLTTFRLIALDVLQKGLPYLNRTPDLGSDGPVFRQCTAPGSRPGSLTAWQWQRLQGHYGERLPQILKAGPLEAVADTDTLWAELVWSAAHESVQHLDDLMLRRTRLGLLLPGGGEAILGRLWQLCAPALGWSEAHWKAERERYLALWARAYGPPGEMGMV